MKRIITLALAGVLASCGGQQQTTTTPSPTGAPVAARGGDGAPSARAALDRFLETIDQQDIQATASIWGTSKGPARDQIERVELEKRIIIMQCYLAHDSYDVLNDSPAADNKREFRVQLTNGGRSAQTTFVAVEGPGRRWYIESAQLEPVQDFCRNPPA